MNNQLTQLRNDLLQNFPERREAIDAILCAVLAGEHALMLGPPGTAKSALIRTIAQSFGGRYWEKLVTKFTTVDEIFGPISLRALEQDHYSRIITGTLAEAQIAFIDEVFKGSSAILNSMLGIMADRVFHNDGQPTSVPLLSLIGASNELPDGRELEALFDRFTVRVHVNYVLREASFKAIVTSAEPATKTALTVTDLEKMSWAASQVKIPDEVVDAVVTIRDALRSEGIIASDRRWRRSLRIVRAAAYLAGEKQAAPEDLAVLTDCLWREPAERSKIARLIGRHADPTSAQAVEIADAAREVAARVSALKAGPDRKAFVAEAASGLGTFTEQQKRLQILSKSAGRRAKTAIAEAAQEISAMHAELGRAVSAGLGIGGTP